MVDVYFFFLLFWFTRLRADEPMAPNHLTETKSMLKKLKLKQLIWVFSSIISAICMYMCQVLFLCHFMLALYFVKLKWSYIELKFIMNYCFSFKKEMASQNESN